MEPILRAIIAVPTKSAVSGPEWPVTLGASVWPMSATWTR